LLSAVLGGNSVPFQTSVVGGFLQMSVPADASRLKAPGMVVAAEVVAKATRRAPLSLMMADELVRDFDGYEV